MATKAPRYTQLKFSDEWEIRASMRKDKKATLRLVKLEGRYVVTTPGGSVISKEVRVLSRWESNMHDRRIALRFRFEGSVWSGTGPESGVTFQCRRTKLNKLYAR